MKPGMSKSQARPEEKNFAGAAPGRRSGTIMVRSGGYVHPMDMEVGDIRLDDITHALSNICRFTGHAREFYSVAEHSVRGARAFLQPEIGGTGGRAYAKAFLLHDAAEYVLNDVARPLKYQPEMQFYREAEERLATLIEERFNLDPGILSLGIIKAMDNVMLATEARDLMSDPPWENMPAPLTKRIIQPWEPKRARREFALIAMELGIK